MNRSIKALFDDAMAATRLELLPVRIRTGLAAGARWSIYPMSSYWRGGHEPEVQAALQQLAPWTGKACWDLGAHFGLYSIGLALATGPTGQVAAFEPNPLSFRRLDYHRHLNRLHWLQAYPLAASDRTSTSELFTYGTLRVTTSHLRYEGETAGPDTHPLTIKTVALDEMVQERRLRPPDFIKVDVEGHAHRALEGARHTLEAHRPLLIVAFHSPHEVAGVLALLNPLKYRQKVIGGPAGPDAALIGRDVLFEPS